jgi:oligopeptidase B
MIKAPTAKKIAKEIITHGHSRIDNYFWMRLSDEQKEAKSPDQQTSDVLAYLNAENDYLKSVMKPTEDLQDSLYKEIVGRIKQDDTSVPVTVNGYSYYSRYEEGQDYPFYCRKKIDTESQEEIMLNGPEMARDQDYFAIGSRTVSENNQLLAYSTDLVSRRQYTIHIKHLQTGDLLSDSIANTSGSITWANDNKTIFYTKKDPVTLRSFQIYSHVIGTEVTDDKVVFEETDETFS